MVEPLASFFTPLHNLLIVLTLGSFLHQLKKATPNRKWLKKVVRPEGFEPPTPRAETWYSIQLSYGRIIFLPFKNIKGLQIYVLCIIYAYEILVL